MTYRKSSYSGGTQNDCVEVAVAGEVTGVRDSKNPAAGGIVVRPAAWSAFVAGVRKDDFPR